jgi:O-methyltransferase involved in polyketide biosynthesis
LAILHFGKRKFLIMEKPSHLESKIEQEYSYEKISPTAKLVAQLRIFTDIPFAKELAEESCSEETFKELVGDMDKSIIGFTPLIEARYKVTDKILEQRGINQVLEIASGLSPRGLAMTENPNVIYVATDLPNILEQEKAIAEKIITETNISRPNLHFQTANVLNRQSLYAAASFFRPSKRIAVVNEGLLMYLNRQEKGAAASNILELLKQNGGLWITPDVSTKKFMERIFQANENLRKIASHISGITERNIENNTFADDDDTRQFFDDAGFVIEEFQHSYIIDELSSVKSLGIERGIVLKILQGRKTIILTPKEN